jgi:hypothetical protein
MIANVAFDEMSDVWACGVTFWEATSYSAVPYSDMDSNFDIHWLKMRLTNGHVLDKPEKCPDELYAVMRKCWSVKKEKRIKFSQLVAELCTVIFELYQINV